MARRAPCAPVGTVRYWAQLARLALRLRRARPDVLLPYTTAPNVACGLVWRLTGAGACVWNQRDLGIDRLPGWLERRAVRSVSAFVANSRTGADYLMRALSVPAEQVHVVRNGVSAGVRRRRPSQSMACPVGVREADLVACMAAHLHRAGITRQCSAHGASSDSSGLVQDAAPFWLLAAPDNTHERLGGHGPGARRDARGTPVGAARRLTGLRVRPAEGRIARVTACAPSLFLVRSPRSTSLRRWRLSGRPWFEQFSGLEAVVPLQRGRPSPAVERVSRTGRTGLPNYGRAPAAASNDVARTKPSCHIVSGYALGPR